MNRTIIIGGGVIGMLTARMLHQEQTDEIILLEKGQLGQESSWAGGGILSPLYPWRYADEISQLAQYGQQYYPDICQDLFAETGIDPEWIGSGLIMLDHDELAEAQQWAKHFTADLQIKNGTEQLQNIEPQLNPQFDKALWMPNIGQVRNPRILKSLIASLRKRQINIHEKTEAQDFIKNSHDEIVAVKTNQGQFEADRVIVCSGAWSGQFTALQQVTVTVKPVLGEMILFNAKPNQLKRIIMQQGRYLIPRKDGKILCGSTLEFKQFNKQISNTAKQELYQAAIRMAPFLKNTPIKHHWCGLRPGSPNGIPYVGEHPKIKNLYINTGHYRYGVIIGLGTVRLLIDYLKQYPSFMDIQHFRLDRERKPTIEFQMVG